MNLAILITPLAAGLAAQLIKFAIKSNQHDRHIKNLLAYSGMPSGHSAMIVALSTSIWLYEGLTSPLFAISAVLTVIVIRDALGIRRYLGQHGRTLNILVKDLADDDVLDKNYPRLLEKIGHTPIQVIAGSLLGIAFSVLGYYLF